MESSERANLHFVLPDYRVGNGWGIVRQPGDAEHGGSSRLSSEIDCGFRLARAAIALDVGWRSDDERGLFFLAGNFIVSRREFRGAGECAQLCRGSLWSESVPGGTYQPEPLAGDCGGVRWSNHCVVERKVRAADIISRLRKCKGQSNAPAFAF